MSCLGSLHGGMSPRLQQTFLFGGRDPDWSTMTGLVWVRRSPWPTGGSWTKNPRVTNPRFCFKVDSGANKCEDVFHGATAKQQWVSDGGYFFSNRTSEGLKSRSFSGLGNRHALRIFSSQVGQVVHMSRGSDGETAHGPRRHHTAQWHPCHRWQRRPQLWECTGRCLLGCLPFAFFFHLLISKGIQYWWKYVYDFQGT